MAFVNGMIYKLYQCLGCSGLSRCAYRFQDTLRTIMASCDAGSRLDIDSTCSTST